MNDKAYLRDELSGKAELLPRKYLRLFPHLREVRTGKPVASGLHRPRTTEAASAYGKLTVPELREEIEQRNVDRDEDLIEVPSSAKKSDIISALEADDLAQKDDN